MQVLLMISDLKPKILMCRIRVKVIRLWKQYSLAGGESIEMVLVDSIGDKIHASVKKYLISQFEDTVEEGATRVMVNFTVSPSCGSYRVSKHPYKIVFQATTRVRNSEALPRNLSGFNPLNYKDLMSGNLDTDFLVDVIGQIVEVSHIEVVAVHGKDTPKLSMQLRNQEDDRIPMVLWDKFAEDVNDSIQIRGDNPLICVMRFGKIKVWKDEHSISNAYNVSHVALNPKMDEVENFRALLPTYELSLAIVESQSLKLASGLAEKEDFFFNTPRKTIEEVKASKQVEKCIVMCTIAGIDSDMGWYYLSCKVCSKKVQVVLSELSDDEGDLGAFSHNYFCVKCNNDSPTLVPRYKLHMVVLDSSSNTKFLLFDNIATQLIRKPCIELTGPVTNEAFEPDEIPAVITDLIGKTYLFKIGIEKENYQYKIDTYKVLKIITNTEMISEFEFNQSPTESQTTYGQDLSIMSEAPEGSLMLIGSASQQSDSCYLTPAKRSGPQIMNLGETTDQNSVNGATCTVKIKKEKYEKSG